MKVFSNKLRSRLRGREEREPSTIRNLLYGILVVLAIVLVGTLSWYVTRLQVFTISHIEISGGETISHDMLRNKVEEILKGDYFLIVPHRFVYLYPHDAIVHAISDVPRVYDVRVNRKPRRTLSVEFKEYVPYALWCLSTENAAPCYFIDETGYAFAPAPQLDGGALTRHIIESQTELRPGSVLSPALLDTIELFMQGLERELSLRVVSIEHTKDGDLRYRVGGGGMLFVAQDMDVNDSFENLRSILDSEEFAHLEPGNFNYIDLRFGNKVFVNERIATSTATSSDDILSE